MLSILVLLLALQTPRMSGKAPPTTINDDATMAMGTKDHYKDGIIVIGKLVWPSDVTPAIIDVELEDQSGIVIQGVKSEPNNQFTFTEVPLVDNVTNSYLNYYIAINVQGLDIVRQQFSPTTENFNGGLISIQLRRSPGLLSRNTEAVISVDSMKQTSTPKEALDAFDKAMGEQHKGDAKKADADLERAVKAAPDFYEANLELGLEYEKANRYEEADRLLKHALQLNPASMKARAALGQRAYETNQFKEATDLLGEAVRLGNISGDVYFMLGASYLKLEDLDSAESSLQRAIAISPGMGRGYLALHNVYLKTHALDKALAQLDTYLEKFPNAQDREQVKSAADKLRKVVHPGL